MLFQDSCVVALGITVMVSLFLPPAVDRTGLVQLSVAIPITLNPTSNTTILRIMFFPVRCLNFSSSLRSLGGLSGLSGELFAARIHRRDAENAELTQRVNQIKRLRFS